MQPLCEDTTSRHDVRQSSPPPPRFRPKRDGLMALRRRLKAVESSQCTGLRVTPEREVIGEDLEV
jgi:hypothetical protein